MGQSIPIIRKEKTKMRTTGEELRANIVPVDNINRCHSCKQPGIGMSLHYYKPYKVKINLCIKCIMKRAWRHRAEAMQMKYAHKDPHKAMANG